MKDKYMQAQICHAIASIHLKHSTYGEGVGPVKDAISLLDQEGRKGEAALARLDPLVHLHAERGEWPEAMEEVNTAVGVFREIGDKSGEAHALFAGASVYNRMGAVAEAHTWIQKAPDIFPDLADNLML